jgi:hypothetical protein
MSSNEIIRIHEECKKIHEACKRDYQIKCFGFTLLVSSITAGIIYKNM